MLLCCHAVLRRFLRSVCMFHSQSEEEVMFPEVLKISSGAGGPQQKQVDTVLATCSTCQDEHTGEVRRCIMWCGGVAE